MTESATSTAIAANRPFDGAVVYLATGGTWRETPEGCRLAADAQDAAAMEALARWAAQTHQVVAPRMVDLAAPCRNRG